MGGATKEEEYLDITVDDAGFYEKTGVLYPSQLQELGFEGDHLYCAFRQSDVKMLLELCDKDPRYHIISGKCGRFENRYVPDRNIYMLAEGDKNPNLVLDMCLKKNPHLLMEEMLDKALAMHHSIDRGDKAK